MKFIPGKHTPRWLIFSIDLCICTFAFVLAYFLRFEFHPPSNEVDLAIVFFPVFIALRALSFFIGKTYAGIIRYTSTQDSVRIFVVVTIGSLAFFVANQVKYRGFDTPYFVPNSILFIEYLASLFILVSSRVFVKIAYMELKTPSKARSRVIIYGAGEAGLITKRTIDQEAYAGMSVVAFLDDDKNKSGKKLEGASIYHTGKADELFASGKVEQIIISIQNIDADKKAVMINKALKYNIDVLNVPPVRSWINGELSLKQIRTIRIEDLLEREAIKLDSTVVREQIKGKRVLVTGAAGSIGSELVRQLMAYEPGLLVTMDQAETPMHELELELKGQWKDPSCEYVVGDVRRADRVRRMFEAYKPEIVFHAAAYKHVPLMEDNPSEAVLTNVLGTKNLVDAASQFGVETFVFISTDKAVNPTSVMGASKRVAEIYTQAMNDSSNTSFITTRFGNVLGSNGSVVQLFNKQIAEGGPLTVTHENVTRYFMTIPEAVQLVLEAGAMGSGGEIYVFDMGESVKIVDLARNMIKLSGLTEGKDIEIKITGLRPGEKLYEELLTADENVAPTHHPKILIANVRPQDKEEVEKSVLGLIELFNAQNNDDIVAGIKELVPEYVSENSEYSKLDS